MAQQLSTNTFTTAKWIVSATSSDGTHTTIASALTSASSGDTIFIRPGTYTENLTLKAGVNLTAFVCDGLGFTTNNVTIVGKCTFTAAGTVNISGIQLQTNSDFLLAVTGSAASIVDLTNCFLNCSNNTGISFSTSSGSAQINCNSCQGNLGTTGIAYFSSSSPGALNFNMCILSNTGASTTASSLSAGTISYFSCSMTFPTTSTSTGSITLQHCNNDTSAINTITITHGGTGLGTLLYSYVASGTASSISIGTGATMGIVNCTVNSTNTNPITGIGTVDFSSNTFSNTGKAINTTTQTYYPNLLGTPGNTAPAAGFIGEVLSGSNTSGTVLSNATVANISSVVLTAGIWDVSGILQFSPTGANTSTSVQAAIATANNTLTPADNFGSGIGMLFNQIAGVPVTATLGTNILLGPARITASTGTTYYLNAEMLASVIACKGYGVIRAVRVG
jgi:hypothetical protein